MTPSGSTELPPSGVQFAIATGRQQVVVTEVGATLRSYTADGEPIFDGCQGRAALDEPERRNAIHGLVRWMPWQMVSRMQNIVSLACVVHPQPAYPWRLELCVEYRLGRDGLAVTTEATNTSGSVAPFGLGFHPYLTVGTTTVDAARLLVPARRRLVADERGLPTGDATVAGTEFDFSAGRPVGTTRLDTAYTQLVRGEDGLARVELDDPQAGRGVTLWVDEHFPHLMAFTGDTVDPIARRRQAIAIEPMSCPPDALRSGVDLVRLEPEQTWRGRWGITPRPPEAVWSGVAGLAVSTSAEPSTTGHDLTGAGGASGRGVGPRGSGARGRS
jgi:aldose 1-epimerase